MITPDLDRHIAFNTHQQNKKICKGLLDSSPVDYFCYQRIFNDGKGTFLFYICNSDFISFRKPFGINRCAIAMIRQQCFQRFRRLYFR